MSVEWRGRITLLVDDARTPIPDTIADILNAIPDGVLLVDHGGLIVWANIAVGQLLLRIPDHLVGQPLDNILDDLPEMWPHGIHQAPVRGVCGDGSIVPFSLTTQAHRHGLVVTLRDTTVLRAAERDVLDAMRQVEMANMAKSKFLDHMSHELRTPLNAVLGFSELLLGNFSGDLTDVQREYVGAILSSGEHLLRIINDILDMAKIDAGRYQLNESDFDLVDLVDSCLPLVRDHAKQGQVDLIRLVVPAKLYADRRASRQVLLNLLTNAVKFTPPGGRVSVTTRPEANGDLSLVVSDTGVGIPVEALEKVFEPFQQAEVTIARAMQGAGLGLSISRSLMELQGGGLTLDSSPERGTVATIRFPALRVLKQDAGTVGN